MWDFQRAVKIDRTTYDKRRVYPNNHGYHVRTANTPALQGIILHTTNNANKTRFDSEALFLFKAATVSAHYLVGKEGQITRFLKPDVCVAWHAGVAKAGWDNNRTVGIEMHRSVGEDATPAQLYAVRDLCLEICYVYQIKPWMIKMHKDVALPLGRKTDPDFWTHEQFDDWLGYFLLDYERYVPFMQSFVS